MLNTYKHCAYPRCLATLQNARGEAFCAAHVAAFAGKCRVVGCTGSSVAQTWACQEHQADFNKHKELHSRSNLSGVRRLISRPGERLPWQNSAHTAQVQAHDEPAPEDDEEDSVQRKHYFSPSRFYCTETACFPCGVVLGWSLFDKSESPTKILRFLETLFPTPDSRPSFICIDKGCQVFRTAVVNGSFETTWKDSRFIVDTYHYSNHKDSDTLCRTWCNPTPLDGSNPNLVELVPDNTGALRMHRLFNTQAAEQLNAWLSGFIQILKCMSIDNFRWFLHSMLYFHTKQIISKKDN